MLPLLEDIVNTIDTFTWQDEIEYDDEDVDEEEYDAYMESLYPAEYLYTQWTPFNKVRSFFVSLVLIRFSFSPYFTERSKAI